MTNRHVIVVGRMYRDIGSWSLGPVGVRRLLNVSSVGLLIAVLTEFGDADLALDGLWITLAIGAFVFGLSRTLLRIAGVLGIVVGYSTAAQAGLVRPIAFELLDLTEWPLMVVIAMVVSLMADRVATTARHYAALYRQASERLVNAHEEERERLARDLHDGVGQTLTAVILSLDAARTDPADSWAVSTAVGRARDLASRALDEARDVSSRLRPARIQQVGLGAAIADLANAAGVQIDLRFDPTSLPPACLEPEREINAFRVVQEALANATRHSHAANMWIDAQVDAVSVRIEVGDDGMGFEPAVATRGGLGILGMEERAELLRGRLMIHTRPGAGTTIELAVPIDPRPDQGVPHSAGAALIEGSR